MAGLILESTFLIDLERQSRSDGPGAARRFLDLHPDESLYITPVVAGELAAGLSMAQRPTWDDLTGRFLMLPIDDEVAWAYGSTYRYLRANGLTIGVNDLWIAAAGLAYKMPVVTRNKRDFNRIPGLEVWTYKGTGSR